MLDDDMVTHLCKAVGLALTGILFDLVLKFLFHTYKEWVEEDDIFKIDFSYIAIRNPFTLVAKASGLDATKIDAKRQWMATHIKIMYQQFGIKSVFLPLYNLTILPKEQIKKLLRNMPEFDILRVNHVDSGFIIAYTCWVVSRTYLAPQDVYDWYNGTYATQDSLQGKYYDFVMKILINKQLHHDGRPLMRTIAFDSMRCLGYHIFMPLYHQGPAAFTAEKLTTLLVDFVIVAVLSSIVSTYVNRDSWFKN